MQRYQRLMAGLNLSDQDEAVIRYAAMLSRMAKSKIIHLVHIVPRLKIPMSIRLRYPNLFRPLMNQMERVTARYWDGRKDIEVAYDVVEGIPLNQLLSGLELNAIDLILVGNKRRERQSDTLPEKLALAAPCSVLIIPEGTKPKLANTLVFSTYKRQDSSAISLFALCNQPAAAITQIAHERRADLVVIDAREVRRKEMELVETLITRLARVTAIPLLIARNNDPKVPVLEAAVDWQEDEARALFSNMASADASLHYAA